MCKDKLNFQILTTNILRAAKKLSKKKAIITKETEITYEKMVGKAEIIAQILINNNIKNNDIIAVIISKSIEQIIAVLGIVLSGAAYLPIDYNWPLEHRNRILREAGVKIILTVSSLKKTLIDYNADIFCVDNIAYFGANNTINRAKKKDLAYILFTSGSTGIPKGVKIQHKAALNTIQDINKRFDVSEKDTIFSISSLNFDLSVYDIFGMLGVGGTLILPSEHEKKNPQIWINYFLTNKITIWNSTPALMELFLHQLEANSSNNFKYKELRLIMLSGDWIPVNILQKTQKFFPNVKVISLGGATECSIWSVIFPIDKINSTWESIPYGKAMKNQTVDIYNEKFEHCSVGDPGEIYIGGEGLSLGYLNDELNTNKAFIIHPKTKLKLYKTGDQGCYLNDGNIKFLGRRDTQIKLNGIRIELKEIEKILLEHSNIKEAIVLYEKDQKKNLKILVAIVVSEKTTIKAIKKYLKMQLPDYMAPHILKILKRIPLTCNGKIDVHTIKIELLKSEKSKKEDLKILVTQSQKKLLEIFQEILNEKDINIKEDFKNLGLNSLAAIKIVTKINTFFNQNFDVTLLMRCSNILNLDLYLKNLNVHRQISNISFIPFKNNKMNKKSIFFIHPIGGAVFCYYEVSQMINANCYGLGFTGTIKEKLSEKGKTLENLALIYKNIILKNEMKEGDIIAGWSFGGLIAYEIAKQLEAENLKTQLIIFDSAMPNEYKFSQNNKKQTNLIKYFINEINKLLNDPLNYSVVDFNKTPFQIINSIYLIIKLKKAKNLNAIKKLSNDFKLFLMLGNQYCIKENIEKINFIVPQKSEKENYLKNWANYSRESIEFFQIPGDHLNIFSRKNNLIIANYMNKKLLKTKNNLFNKNSFAI